MHVHRRTERDPRWNTVSIVVQGAMNALDPVMRVSDQIATAIWLHDPGADDGSCATSQCRRSTSRGSRPGAASTPAARLHSTAARPTTRPS